MNVEELLELHNRVLNRKVEENVFLSQRLTARVQGRERLRHSGWRLSFKKPVLVYGFLFFLFTLLNFIVVDHLKKREVSPPQASQSFSIPSAFSPDYPGSIAYAYREVMK
jgi:hypothetical protein